MDIWDYKPHLWLCLTSYFYLKLFKRGSLKSTFSDPQSDVTHGSILSVTFVSVKINSFTVFKPLLITRYVSRIFRFDTDRLVWVSLKVSCSFVLLKFRATDSCFKFSKTVSMHICQKRGLRLDPIFFWTSPIPVVDETTLWGVISDMKLSVIQQLKYVKKNGLKAHNIFYVIGNTECGDDQNFMFRIYRYLDLT